MTEQSKIPYKILEAYDLLLQYRIVNIIQPLDWNSDEEGWTFEFEVNVIPNQQGITSPVKLLAVIPEPFPLQPVNFYPLSRDICSFPHQSIETGMLCLPGESLAPRDSKRLVCYVKWAMEWLMDAAKGTLLKVGDPYELPLFPCKRCLTVFHNEDFSTYETWRPLVGENGTVECVLGKSTRGLFVTVFRDSNDSVILEDKFSSSNIYRDKIITGEWFILPDICYYRHRPPLTFKEMNELCTKHGLDFYNILKKAWKAEKDSIEQGLILVGFPIPKVVGGNTQEIHWQPLLFDNLKADRKKVSGNKKIKPRKIWAALIKDGRFNFSSELPWAKAANITNNRLYSRGAYTKAICDAHIAIFGCGALGSSIAELLVRGGVKKMDLLDYDIVQFGNLCRHTLDGSHVGWSKAESLGTKLSSINPLSIINGYMQSVPLTSKTPEIIHQAVKKTDILIDCTTSESAFEWLNNYAVDQNKVLISTFFDFYAKHLTLCISGKENSCEVIYRELLRLINNNELPVSPEEYFYKPTKDEEVIEGAGCWHATFPALNNHIQMLAASAVDLINAHFQQGGGKGLAMVIKRNPINEATTSVLPLITLWKKEYP